MGDPEGLILEGARWAATAARALWWRARPPEARGELPLERVKRRLELFVAAVQGEAPAFLPADAPPAPSWLARALRRVPAHRRAWAAAATDGTCVWLPRSLPAPGDDAAALSLYRVLAVEQVARALRGTPEHLPVDPLEQDLYLLAEAVAVDRALAGHLPGLLRDLCAARADALDRRPAAERLTPRERLVEAMVRDVLSAPPAAPPATVPASRTAAESLVWARATAARLASASGRYRGVAEVAAWGRVLAPPTGPPTEPHTSRPEPAVSVPAARTAPLARRPRVRHAEEGEDDVRPGTWMIRADQPMESVEDPMGLQRPADRDDEASAADLADSLSELREARVVRTPGTPREVLVGDGAPAPRTPAPESVLLAGAGIVYPEWDYRVAAYRRHGAVVRPGALRPGPAAWVESVRARHAALVRRVRRRFDGLRPRRVRVARQADGSDLDLAAYVDAFADWRARRPGDDRFYTAARPARRDLAIVLLIDVSASTDSWVGGSLRIIDVEKESLVVLLEALDALGDRHAVLAFSGEGPGAVRVTTIKGFDERGGLEVQRRVAALEPDAYTRAGAAVRHASALLAREAARHRLLLVLSDGKPNDVDGYEGRYGIEDTRQAVAEARVQGLVPFCLTIDREAPAYMPSIFGAHGYAVLRRLEFLPSVVVDVARRLLVA
jgi:nitric oxide reductase NorD protein